MPNIRPFHPDDAPAVAAIFNQYLGQAMMQLSLRPASDFLVYDPALDNRHVMVVAEVEGEVVGYASVMPWSTREGYHPACEVSIFLDKSHTSKGTGSALYTNLCPRVRAQKYTYVVAKIQGDNAGSIRFHEQHGFTMVGVQRGIGMIDGEERDVAIMERRI